MPPKAKKPKNKAIALAYYEEFKTVPQGTVLVAYAKEKFGKKMGVIKAMAMKEFLHKHEEKMLKTRKEELHAPALKKEELVIMGGQVLNPKGHVAFNRHIRQSESTAAKKVQKADAPQWKAGDRVILHNMGKDEFNGKKGTVTKYISKHDRFKVKLDDGEVVAIMGCSMRAGLCKAADCVEEDLQPYSNDAPAEEAPAQSSTPDEAPAQPSTPDEAPAQPSTPDEAPTEDAPAQEQNADTDAPTSSDPPAEEVTPVSEPVAKEATQASEPNSGEVTESATQEAHDKTDESPEPNANIPVPEVVDVAAKPVPDTPETTKPTVPQEPPTSETADQPEITEPDEPEDSVSSFSDTPELKIDMGDPIADPGAGVVAEEERELEPQPPSDYEEAVDVGACANVDVTEEPVKTDNIVKVEATHWTCESCSELNTQDRNECNACSTVRPQDVT